MRGIYVLQGFEARGTMLAQRLNAWHNLMEATKTRGELTNNPLEYEQYIRQLNQQVLALIYFNFYRLSIFSSLIVLSNVVCIFNWLNSSTLNSIRILV